jgi:hypothetical protein
VDAVSGLRLVKAQGFPLRTSVARVALRPKPIRRSSLEMSFGLVQNELSAGSSAPFALIAGRSPFSILRGVSSVSVRTSRKLERLLARDRLLEVELGRAMDLGDLQEHSDVVIAELASR